MQFDGQVPEANTNTWVLNTELGLTPRFEAGIDLDLSSQSDSRGLLNAKYVLTTDNRRWPALAIGVCNAWG